MVGLEANNDMGDSFKLGTVPIPSVMSATLWREPAADITRRWNPGWNPWRTGW